MKIKSCIQNFLRRLKTCLPNQVGSTTEVGSAAVGAAPDGKIPTGKPDRSQAV